MERTIVPYKGQRYVVICDINAKGVYYHIYSDNNTHTCILQGPNDIIDYPISKSAGIKYYTYWIRITSVLHIVYPNIKFIIRRSYGIP